MFHSCQTFITIICSAVPVIDAARIAKHIERFLCDIPFFLKEQNFHFNVSTQCHITGIFLISECVEIHIKFSCTMYIKVQELKSDSCTQIQ